MGDDPLPSFLLVKIRQVPVMPAFNDGAEIINALRISCTYIVFPLAQNHAKFATQPETDRGLLITIRAESSYGRF